MANSISPIPPVPQSIKDAINEEKLAVFIGAGVSRLVGCLGWGDLAKSLINRCHEEKIINFKEKETLSQIPDHKKTITICYHLFRNNHLADLFYKEMSAALQEGSNDSPQLYKDIYKLRGLFITTNADTLFDHLFNEPNILFKLNDFDANRIDKTNLYHIHGSIRDRESLVFTVSKYIDLYSNPDFKRFLERIFREYIVLFLGYGVSEFEILDFILRNLPSHANRSETQREESPHYILMPFYKGEENILKYEQTYYSDIGVNVLGYEKDTKGYKQLIDVVSAWNNEINQVTTYQYATFREIDEALE